MATIEERLAALEALLGLSEGEAPYVSKYSGPEIDEGIELARSGTVRKTGDKMTGNLTVEKSTPIVNLNDTAVGTGGRVFSANNRIYAQIANISGSDANRRQLALANSAAVDKTKALALHDIVEGNLTAYYLYGEHNKPTPEAIGAVASAGGIMTGNLTIKKSAPYFTLSHSETGRQFRLAETGDNYASLYNEVADDATNNKAALWLAPEGAAMDKLLRINVVKNGVSDTYSVLHTGNMNSLISSLRIATGTYTGTGNYGGTVTLTCGFKPAFAIVYQADANDLAVSEEDGGWSSTFAVLVPTATGRKISIGQTSVSVESGDTYLKISSTAYELNQNITYNYIIVGS